MRKTSMLAYHYIMDSGKVSERRRQVYDVLYRFGPMTANELFQKFQKEFGFPRDGRNQFNVTSRLGELRDIGVTQEIRDVICSVTGMTTIQWDVTDSKPIVKGDREKLAEAIIKARRYKDKFYRTVREIKELRARV